MEWYQEYVGKRFNNSRGLPFEILEYTGFNKHKQRTYTIRFCNSGSIRYNITLPNITRGCVKDYYAPTIAGVGYLGKLSKKDNPHEYSIWVNMLSRCYQKEDPGYRWYGAKGITVCERWLCFENFVKDVPTLPGFNSELFDAGMLKLDKDFSKGGQYSPTHCCFVTHSLNMKEAFLRYNKTKSRKIAVFPDGHKELVTNLSDFCRMYNLCYRNVYHRLNNDLQVNLNGFDFFYDRKCNDYSNGGEIPQQK